MGEIVENKPDFSNIDFVKFVMAFAVVAIHTGLHDIAPEGVARTIIDQIINLGVPFFFLASGYLLMSKMTSPSYSAENARMLRHHLWKIVKLYLIWMTIYLPMTIFVYMRDGVAAPISAFMIAKGYILTGEQFNAWHFWYLLSTIYALIIIIVLLRIRIPVTGLLLFSLLASVCGIGLQILPQVSGNLPYILKFVQYMLSYNLINNRIFNGLVYIPVGMCLYKYSIPKWINYVLVMAGFLMNIFITNPAGDMYLLVATSVGLFGIVRTIAVSEKINCPLLRKMSTYIYLVHMYMWTLYYVVVRGHENYGLEAFICTAVLSAAASYIIVKVSLFGDRSKH